MEVKRISPAPKATDFARIRDGVDPGRVSSPVGEDLPAIRTDPLGIDGDHDALIAEFSAAIVTKPRSATAAVLIDTLSAPEANRLRMSSMLRTPPPTVSGMKHAWAVRRTTSSMMPRFSWLAVISRKHSSSAPAAS